MVLSGASWPPWPSVRSAVLLAIFTVLPFVYVVPLCLPRLELATGHTSSLMVSDGFTLERVSRLQQYRTIHKPILCCLRRICWLCPLAAFACVWEVSPVKCHGNPCSSRKLSTDYINYITWMSVYNVSRSAGQDKIQKYRATSKANERANGALALSGSRCGRSMLEETGCSRLITCHYKYSTRVNIINFHFRHYLDVLGRLIFFWARLKLATDPSLAAFARKGHCLRPELHEMDWQKYLILDRMPPQQQGGFPVMSSWS